MLDMNEQIKQIAERLAGLREVLELTPEEVARTCRIPVDEYNRMESGKADIPVGVLHQIAEAYGVELTALMFGDEPKMDSYFITRKNKGIAVERVKAYKYQSLAAGFARRKCNPFLVTVHPKPEDEPVYRNSHPGQEFNYVVRGRMMVEIGGKQLVLEEGDSIYFDSRQPHGMKALDGEKVCFLNVIV